jgi:serine/threonine-protein kinase
MVKGKVSYMPPEQLLGKGVDERADVYATGVVMWEMLTGRRLFVGDDPGMLLARVQRGAANSPRVLAPEVPEAIDAVCMRALKLHDERWPSASAFADALEAAAAECGTTIASARQIVPYAKSAAEAPAATTGSSSGQRALSMTPTPSHLRAAAVAKGTGVGQEVSIPIAFGETGVVPLARARGGEPEPSSSRTLLAIACLLGVAILGVAIFLAVRSPSSAGGADAPLASSSAAGASSDSTGASASGGPAPTPQPPPTAGALPATTVPSVQVIKRGAKPAPTWRRGPAK